MTETNQPKKPSSLKQRVTTAVGLVAVLLVMPLLVVLGYPVKLAVGMTWGRRFL